MSKNNGDLGPTIYSISNLISRFNSNDCAEFKNHVSNRFIKTGFNQFDTYVCFEQGKLIVFAGPPAMGTTALCLSLIDKMTENKENRVRYFSIGENATDVFEKIIVNHTEKSTKVILNELKDSTKKNAFLLTVKELISKKLIIDDEKFDSYIDLTERIRHDQLTRKSSVYFVDNIQLLGKCGKSKLEMNLCLKSLKHLAVEYNCVIVILSGTSKTIVKRKNKKPKLSDLTDLGAFNRYADFIGLLYRPEYYGFCETKKKKSTNGLMTLFIKQINGEKYSLKFRFRLFAELHKFIEIHLIDESN